jgi:hypothetical protein
MKSAAKRRMNSCAKSRLNRRAPGDISKYSWVTRPVWANPPECSMKHAGAVIEDKMWSSAQSSLSYLPKSRDYFRALKFFP